MYTTSYNTPFLVNDDGDDSIIGHQRVISKLTVDLGILYYYEKTLSLMPLPETPCP